MVEEKEVKKMAEEDLKMVKNQLEVAGSGGAAQMLIQTFKVASAELINQK